MVSLTSGYDQNSEVLRDAPIDRSAVVWWLERSPNFRLDDRLGPSPDDVVRRLGEFWLRDESILYIGMTKQPLRKRVGQHHQAKLGGKRPRRGGHWIKALPVLRETFVHYAESPTPEESKHQLLGRFVAGVTSNAKEFLRDAERPFPFANPEFPRGNRKKHGLGGQAT